MHSPFALPAVADAVLFPALWWDLVWKIVAESTPVDAIPLFDGTDASCKQFASFAPPIVADIRIRGALNL